MSEKVLFDRPSRLLQELLEVNGTQMKILWLLWYLEGQEEGQLTDGISSLEIAEYLRRSHGHIRNEIKKLVDRNLLSRKQSGRAFRYQSNPESFQKIQNVVNKYVSANQRFVNTFSTFSTRNPINAIQALQQQTNEFVTGWKTVGAGWQEFWTEIPPSAPAEALTQVTQWRSMEAPLVKAKTLSVGNRNLMTTRTLFTSEEFLRANLLDALIPLKSQFPV